MCACMLLLLLISWLADVHPCMRFLRYDQGFVIPLSHPPIRVSATYLNQLVESQALSSLSHLSAYHFILHPHHKTIPRSFSTSYLFTFLISIMAAVAGPSTPSYLGRAADFVRPDFHQVNLGIEGYLKTERNFNLDEGESLLLIRAFTEQRARKRVYAVLFSPIWTPILIAILSKEKNPLNQC